MRDERNKTTQQIYECDLGSENWREIGEKSEETKEHLLDEIFWYDLGLNYYSIVNVIAVGWRRAFYFLGFGAECE